MDNKLHVLLLVSEPWRNDDGGGNTLNNFFEGMNAEFAQVYCSSRLPENEVCSKYFQMTDGAAVRSFLNRKPFGRVLELDVADYKNKIGDDEAFISKLKKIKTDTFLLLKEVAWFHSNWKTTALEEFIVDFNPDVIYAPCYASPFMLALTRWAKKFTGCKIVTWSADDNYSLRQFSFSLAYWIKRFWVRACLRETYPYYDLFYSISEDEAEEMSNVAGQDIKILRKTVPDNLDFQEKEIGKPIKMIYAGGIYLNRWKVLAKIGDALRQINKDEIRCVLEIYTQNQLTKKQEKALNDGKNVFCHKAVDTEELKKLYYESDIALHVETQKLKYKLMTRLSFSTKIIDCLASGCAIMVIAWKEQTGLKYLQTNKAAICIDDEREIENVIRKVIEQPNMLLMYAKNAYNLAMKNHKRSKIQNELFNGLSKLRK